MTSQRNDFYFIKFFAGSFLVLILFLSAFASEESNLIEFYDASLYTQLKSRYSVNTNFPNKSNELFQQLTLKLRVNLKENLFIYSVFKTEYSQFHWQRDDRNFFLNSLGAEYKGEPHINFKVGSLFLNYSPYLLKNYPWEGDIFRGIEFIYNQSTFSFQSFVANNGDDPDEGELIDAIPTIDNKIDRDNSTIDLGYNELDKKKERPCWWYGGKIEYKTPPSETFVVGLGLIGLNEEFQFTSEEYNNSQVYQNQYAYGIMDFNFFQYLSLNGHYSKTYSKVDHYNVYTNHYADDKHLFKKESSKRYEPEFWKAGAEIKSLLGNSVDIYRTSVAVVYDKLDERYTPRYLDSKYQTRRSFDPEINVYSGRKGYFIVAKQFIFKETSIGYGYKEHQFRKSEIIPFLNYGKAVEHQIRFEEDYFSFLHLKFIYQLQQAKKGTFADGKKELNAFYIQTKGDIIDHVMLEIEYAKNLDYYKGFDQFSMKLLIWGL